MHREGPSAQRKCPNKSSCAVRTRLVEVLVIKSVPRYSRYSRGRGVAAPPSASGALPYPVATRALGPRPLQIPSPFPHLGQFPLDFPPCIAIPPPERPRNALNEARGEARGEAIPFIHRGRRSIAPSHSFYHNKTQPLPYTAGHASPPRPRLPYLFLESYDER